MRRRDGSAEAGDEGKLQRDAAASTESQPQGGRGLAMLGALPKLGGVVRRATLRWTRSSLALRSLGPRPGAVGVPTRDAVAKTESQPQGGNGSAMLDALPKLGGVVRRATLRWTRSSLAARSLGPGPGAEVASAGSRKRLMIVDDSAMMRLIIESAFKNDPHWRLVGTAANGREALEKLPTLQPDLILLDIEMPVMDGIEFLLRARPRAKVIVLSSGPDKVDAARAAGADAVISKPSGSISYDFEERRGSELRQTANRLLGIAVP
jgi:two-component system, chemotaxis family, protein-glutamate methylesterase/glutaminase